MLTLVVINTGFELHYVSPDHRWGVYVGLTKPGQVAPKGANGLCGDEKAVALFG